MSFLCDSIYFITVFLFGTVASVCFTGVPFNRKNMLTLSVFCALDGILQIISFAVFGQEISRGLYPVVVHLPLVLFLWLIYKVRIGFQNILKFRKGHYGRDHGLICQM